MNDSFRSLHASAQSIWEEVRLDRQIKKLEAQVLSLRDHQPTKAIREQIDAIRQEIAELQTEKSQIVGTSPQEATCVVPAVSVNIASDPLIKGVYKQVARTAPNAVKHPEHIQYLAGVLMAWDEVKDGKMSANNLEKAVIKRIRNGEKTPLQIIGTTLGKRGEDSALTAFKNQYTRARKCAGLPPVNKLR